MFKWRQKKKVKKKKVESEVKLTDFALTNRETTRRSHVTNYGIPAPLLGPTYPSNSVIFLTRTYVTRVVEHLRFYYKFEIIIVASQIYAELEFLANRFDRFNFTHIPIKITRRGSHENDTSSTPKSQSH